MLRGSDVEWSVRFIYVIFICRTDLGDNLNDSWEEDILFSGFYVLR